MTLEINQFPRSTSSVCHVLINIHEAVKARLQEEEGALSSAWGQRGTSEERGKTSRSQAGAQSGHRVVTIDSSVIFLLGDPRLQMGKWTPLNSSVE